MAQGDEQNLSPANASPEQVGERGFTEAFGVNIRSMFMEDLKIRLAKNGIGVCQASGSRVGQKNSLTYTSGG